MTAEVLVVHPTITRELWWQIINCGSQRLRRWHPIVSADITTPIIRTTLRFEGRFQSDLAVASGLACPGRSVSATVVLVLGTTADTAGFAIADLADIADFVVPVDFADHVDSGTNTEDRG